MSKITYYYCNGCGTTSNIKPFPTMTLLDPHLRDGTTWRVSVQWLVERGSEAHLCRECVEAAEDALQARRNTESA